MQSKQREQPYGESAEQILAFCACIVRNSLLHLTDKPIDALHVHRFQALGLFAELKPQPFPDDTVEVLLIPSHPKRLQLPDGPLVFIRHGATHRSVVEVAPMLLNTAREVRDAALKYFQRSAASRDPFLTPRTSELLTARSSEIQSDDLTRWRAAGIELVAVLRNDFFGHVAGLLQCLVANYEEGFEEFVQRVMRPSFASLANLCPPIVSATEQRIFLLDQIVGFARHATLEAALTDYYNLCGHLPLCEELGASEVAKRWIELHPGNAIRWEELMSWARAIGTPFARYHTVTIALSTPAARPADSRELWDEVFAILDTTGPLDAEPSSQAIWTLYCELATHFARHVEALHPGQDGERIACYAWWLAGMIGRIFGQTAEQAKNVLDQIVRPELGLSFLRWTIARSPVVPSSFRYVTLFSRSTWALSLIVQLDRAAQSLNAEEIPPAYWKKLASITGGYLITSPPTDDNKSASPVFAIEEQSQMANLLREGGVLGQEDRGQVIEASHIRQEMEDIDTFKSRLERLGQLDEVQQRLTMLFLRAVAFSTKRYDDVLSEWLSRSTAAVEAFQQLPESALQPMIEALEEFQLRPRVDWPIRLPHMLAYSIERIDDLDRFAILHVHTLVMSINAGIVSPIQRLTSSKWRSESIARIRVWRENILLAAQFSAPWVAARVRATSAAISRLIGPRVSRQILSGLVTPVDSATTAQ